MLTFGHSLRVVFNKVFNVILGPVVLMVMVILAIAMMLQHSQCVLVLDLATVKFISPMVIPALHIIALTFL